MGQIITKSDFNSYVQFTQNIPDRLVNYHIDRAEQLDFRPRVPVAFWNKVVEGSPGPGSGLTSFITNFIKPILILEAYCRFLIEHGSNITQFGITKEAHPDIDHVSDIQRSQVRTQYQNDLAVYWTKFYNELVDKSYTFDGVVYDFDCTKKRKRNFATQI